jgi:hypothetical protein
LSVRRPAARSSSQRGELGGEVVALLGEHGEARVALRAPPGAAVLALGLLGHVDTA